MTLEPCVNLRTLGYGITGVQRYLLSLLPYMPSELKSVRPPEALQGIKGHLWEQFYLPTQLSQQLLWSPGNTGPLGLSRQVLTLHDIASLDHPEWFERKFAVWYSVLLPRLIRKVRAIITVSQFSKERILEVTRVKSDNVHVVHNGVDGRFRFLDSHKVDHVKTEFDIASPYLLFVGSLEPRKNLRMLFAAWESGGFDGATLAVAGTSGSLFQKMRFDSMPRGIRLLGRVEDDALAALYSGASGFVYPSIYEGFGLPPLEAMACGCPVAVSDIPAHREICGGAAMYFDPVCLEDITAKLKRLLDLNGASRASVVNEGVRRAALYNWQSAASETWRILSNAAND